MKKFIIVIMIILLASVFYFNRNDFFAAKKAQAAVTTYYVDATGGLDTNNGQDTSHAWKTINKVNTSVFNAGDSILFKKGETWRENLVTPSAGSAGLPITFSTYGTGGAPVISGANIVAGPWTSLGSGVYTAAVTTQPRIVIFDGTIGQLVANAGAVDSTGDWFWAANVLTIYSATDPAGRTIEAGARNDVVNGSVAYITIDGLSIKYGNQRAVYSTSNFWTVQNSTITGTGTSATVLISGTDWSVLNNTISYSGTYGVSIGGVRCLVQGNTITNSTQDGIYGNAANATISSNNIYDSLRVGVNLKAASPLVQGNTILRSATDAVDVNTGVTAGQILGNTISVATGYGVYVNVASTLVQGNTISLVWNGLPYGSGGSGFGIALLSSDGIARGNTITDCNEGITEGGASATRNIIDRNLVIHSRVNDISSGTTNTVGTITNNTVIHQPSYTSGHGIVAQGTSNGFVVKNNIVYGTYTGVSVNVQLICIASASYTAVNVDYNYYYTSPDYTGKIGKLASTEYNTLASWQSALVAAGYTGNDLHSIYADPAFVNAASNYHLLSTSAAIDVGTTIVGGSTTDLSGNPIYGNTDIGAYEYQPPYVTNTNSIDASAGARIYANGKFRNLGTASGSSADLVITPQSGSFTAGDYSAWMDISNLTWSNTGTHHKIWTESSFVSGLTNTLHTVGNLDSNTFYTVKIDNNTAAPYITGADCSQGICKSDDRGRITFTYIGSYSSHTFDVEQYIIQALPDTGIGANQ